MSIQSVLLVTFLFLYLVTTLVNCAPQSSETEESNFVNGLERPVVPIEMDQPNNTDELNPIIVSKAGETESSSRTTVSKRTTLAEESDDSSEPKLTYISTLEKFLKGVMASLSFYNAASGEGGVLSKIPGFKRIENGVGRAIGGFSDAMNIVPSQVQAVFPGTYWCGAGDAAPSENDLGVFEKTDACCKEHDACQDSILAGQRRQRLLNNGIFTRSHCNCDQAFYECLKNANTIISSKIGKTYFNILSPQCFREEYPIVGCNQYESKWRLGRKCEIYDYDYTGERTNQWFDNPSF